ncbi:unnamed protein product, partial [Allacma fusca]
MGNPTSRIAMEKETGNQWLIKVRIGNYAPHP